MGRLTRENGNSLVLDSRSDQDRHWNLLAKRSHNLRPSPIALKGAAVMRPLRDVFASIRIWQIGIVLGLLVSCFGAFAAGELWMRRADVAEINEANRRIEHLNLRLKAALENDAPPSCPAPQASET